tara:strand:+ start:1198 stop:1647 length:450 start_codon:yes stop_codon:yes gene_type:complete
MKIINSNKSEFIGKDFLFNLKQGRKIQISKPGFFKSKLEYEYPFSEVTNFKEVGGENTETSVKKGLGTIAGGAAGGLIAGGAGAVIGGLAGGNKIKKTSTGKFAMEFNKQDWLIFEVDNLNEDTIIGRLNRLVINEMYKEFSAIQDSPF